MSDDTTLEAPDRGNAYAGLHDTDGDLAEGHWAFGTGFADPLAGVDTALPAGVDAKHLAETCLGLADDALVHAQRLSEWLAHGPELEEEVALANIALDLLGQARLLYARAGQADPGCVPVLDDSPAPAEDLLAYFRDASGFRNVRLVELPRGDFAFTVVRLLACTAWRIAALDAHRAGTDPVLAAVAAKGVTELRYHGEYAARWVTVLAGGTTESRRRVQEGLAQVVPHLAELDRAAPEVAEVARRLWAEAWEPTGLDVNPSLTSLDPPDGRDGEHTEHLAPLLVELQSVARAHPQGRW